MINEEINYMKYLFGYQRGKVISEQTTPVKLNPDGCQNGYYRDCNTKTCVKTPKGSTIVYSQEEFDEKQKIYESSKEHNRKGLHLMKTKTEFNKKTGSNYVEIPKKLGNKSNLFVGLPSGYEKVIKNGASSYGYIISNRGPSYCSATLRLPTYENKLRKENFKLSGMYVGCCEGHYYPLLIVSKPILACPEISVTTGTTDPTPVVTSGTTDPTPEVEQTPILQQCGFDLKWVQTEPTEENKFVMYEMDGVNTDQSGGTFKVEYKGFKVPDMFYIKYGESEYLSSLVGWDVSGKRNFHSLINDTEFKVNVRTKIDEKIAEVGGTLTVQDSNLLIGVDRPPWETNWFIKNQTNTLKIIVFSPFGGEVPQAFNVNLVCNK